MHADKRPGASFPRACRIGPASCRSAGNEPSPADDKGSQPFSSPLWAVRVPHDADCQARGDLASRTRHLDGVVYRDTPDVLR